jgi:hypothetical protein
MRPIVFGKFRHAYFSDRLLVPMLLGHSADSNMLQDIVENLKLGATVIVDLSRMGLGAAFNLMSFVIDEIFELNQEIFVSGSTLPEIVIFVEESQNLLSTKQVIEGNTIVRLAKEGRKYNLGLVYVTQQPGAIAEEIVSQTNNFFVLHLLSKIDTNALTRINPHYDGITEDFIRMESLQGHAYIYSTVPGMPSQPYVFATKATSFDITVDDLSKLGATGNRAIESRRKEIVAKLTKDLQEIIVSQRVLSTSPDGVKKYNSAPISGELAKRLPPDLDIVRSTRNRDYVDSVWLERACEGLGFNAKVEWNNTDRKMYLYLKDKMPAPPQIKRSGSAIDF